MKRSSAASGNRRVAGLISRFLILSCVLAAASARADLLTWDGGAAGVWTNTGGGWLSGVTPAAWNSTTPDDAVFSGAAPSSVAVAANGITVGDITVSSGTYELAGPGAVTLSSSQVSIGSALTTTVSAALAGTTGLTKAGDGTLLMSGANKNYSGPTVINGGAIRVTAAGAGTLGATATQEVQLAGGRLEGLFSSNTALTNNIVVGAAGGELRNLGNDSQRWVFSSGRIAGSGVLTLSFGTNNTRFQLNSAQSGFSGKWIVDSGGSQNRLVDIANSSAFGTATGDDAITVRNNGSVALRNGVTLGSASQGVTLGAGETKIESINGATATIAAKISGAAGNSVQFYMNSASSTTILSNTANNWQGATSLQGLGTLRLGAAGVLPDAGGTVTINSTAALDMNGFSEAIGGLSGAGRIDNRAAATASILTVGGNDATTTFTGIMTNSGAGATLGLVKTGSGTLTLASTNVYVSTVAVTGGTLVVNGLLPTISTTVVYNASIFGGTGTVGRLVIESGGTLSPGTSPGTLRVDTLTLAGGAKLTYELAADSGVNDRVLVAGLLTLGGQQFSDFTFTALSGFGAGEYTLISAGSISGSLGGSTSGTISGNGATLSLKNNDLVLTVVPEPGTAALLVMAGGLLWAARRRTT